MAFCRNCGKELKEDDRFCANCGARVGENVGQPDTSLRTTDASKAYKGVGIRFVAHLVDAILVFVFFFIAGRIIGSISGGATDEGFDLRGGPALLLMLMTFVVSMGYFIILEAKWNGQTIGKKLVGIRVANEIGEAADMQQTTLRNLLRIIDVLPFFYLVGVILIWTGDRKQRLGDRVANTFVVKAGSMSPRPG